MIDPAYLRQRLRYEPETGKLFWRAYAAHPQRWNTRYAGKEAFTARDSNGYLHGTVDNRSLRAHLAIWAMHHDAWPSHDVDHEDHDRTNNRIGNLQAATRADNCRNASRSRRNTSGVTGVYWCAKSSKWVAQLQRRHLGTFSALEDAARCRKAAEAKHGYHPNHGATQ